MIYKKSILPSRTSYGNVNMEDILLIVILSPNHHPKGGEKKKKSEPDSALYMTAIEYAIFHCLD